MNFLYIINKNDSEQLLKPTNVCFLRGDDLPPEWKGAYISNLQKKDTVKSSATAGF